MLFFILANSLLTLFVVDFARLTLSRKISSLRWTKFCLQVFPHERLCFTRNPRRNLSENVNIEVMAEYTHMERLCNLVMFLTGCRWSIVFDQAFVNSSRANCSISC